VVVEVLDLDQERWLRLEPAHHTKTTHTLGDELDLVAGTHRLVHAHHRAHGVEIPGGGALGILGARQQQAHGMLRRIADLLHGLEPRLLVHQQWQRLSRKERPLGERQQVHRGWQDLVGDGDLAMVRWGFVPVLQDFGLDGVVVVHPGSPAVPCGRTRDAWFLNGVTCA
jgi:hypothetical protein